MTSYATLDTYFSSHCDYRRGFWVLWDCCRGGGYRQDPVLYFYRALFGLVHIRQEKYLARVRKMASFCRIHGAGRGSAAERLAGQADQGQYGSWF